ncbi:MAG: glycosyltransferase family 2 protein [bacterium]|nr:glycosyltransferase family 2 protein [bacterium]MCP5071362.1 glycosyltransferase family 2 protein [bacterium]
MTDLSIVIVTWNAREVLLDALESIEREILGRQGEGRIEVETLVVDNGSEDGSVQTVRQKFGWADVIALPQNIGFAAGNNVGLARAKGRHSVLLNSDTVVLPDALEKCVRYLDAHPEVGVVGPQLLNPDLTKQNCIHNYPSLVTEIFPKGVLEKLFPRRFPSKRFEHPEPIPVEAVLGACLFVRREVLERVGPMPEDYFFFLEETDWCYRIAAAGWKIMHVPDAQVIHVFGASTKKKIPAETRIEYHRSLYHFFRKNRGGTRAAWIKTLRIAKALLYVMMRGPGAVFSSSMRGRWEQDWRVLRWHLRGCPENEGLRALRAADQEGETA